ncbi:MAG: TonB-dependent receptor [Alphaproteobacteria bacterium CG_4_10_14_0_2_um_filter_63_37]|nr:MAG: hypothetical protein AUJ55_02495 [Proteobacteria bacterium CG1_02_64_396]PJA24565.1 MAG: TonB-dependent receptor [Alphaproteobacteria bacterium CG_4_10_14_0_2_um_filter_63_37]
MIHTVRRRHLILALAGVALLPSAVHAENLGTIRVESTTIDDRFEARRGEPVGIETIDGSQVDAAHAENIQQLLQGIPGITTEFDSGDTLKIHIRGIENQRFMGEKPGVAVVIDGVPVFERTGKVNIDLDNIESIRVIKGGASFLFGEDALSGAVIITTKRGARHAGVTAAAEAGSFDYTKGMLRVGTAQEGFNAFVQANARKSDGYYYQSGYLTQNVSGKGQIYLSDDADLTFGAEVAHRKKDSHGSVKGVTQAALDPQSDQGRDYARMFNTRLDKYFATYALEGNRNNLMVTAYRYGDHTNFSSAPQNYTATGAAVTDIDAYTSYNDYRQTQAGVKSELRGSGDLGWMVALDLRANTYINQSKYLVDFKSSPFSPAVNTAGTVTADDTTKEGVQALYGELKLPAGADLTFTLNGRYDHIKLDYTGNPTAKHTNTLSLNKAFDVASWRVGANYDLGGDDELYVSASTGFRTPTVDQLFAGTISPTGTTASNEGLKPEQALNYELGSRFHGNGWTLEGALFWVERKDFIMSSVGQYSVTPSGTTAQWANIGAARSKGLELAAHTDTAAPLAFDLAYTYLDASFTQYDNFYLVLGSRYVANPTVVHYNNTGNTVPRTPKHHLNVGMTARTSGGGFTLRGEVDAISSYWADEINQEKIGGHASVNLLGTWRMQGAGGDWELFARVDNVLDTRYFNTARSASGDGNGDGVYNAEDLSIVVNQGRTYTAGITGRF